MNGVETLRSGFRASHQWFDGTLADVTNEQANFVPPGKAHPISELATHTIQSEDAIIHGMLQGEPTIWEREGWGERLGLPNMTQHTTEAARAFRCDVEALQEYKEQVYAATELYLDSLTDEDLDEEVDLSAFGMDSMRVGDVLPMFCLGNTFAHTGEISALKGIQGATGYPF